MASDLPQPVITNLKRCAAYPICEQVQGLCGGTTMFRCRNVGEYLRANPLECDKLRALKKDLRAKRDSDNRRERALMKTQQH